MNKVFLVIVIFLVLFVLISGCSVPKYNRVTLWWNDMKAEGYFDKKTGEVKLSELRFVSDKAKKGDLDYPVQLPDIFIKTGSGDVFSLRDIVDYIDNMKLRGEIVDNYVPNRFAYDIDTNFGIIVNESRKPIVVSMRSKYLESLVVHRKGDITISCLYDPVTKKDYPLPLKYEDAIKLFGEPKTRADWFTW